MKLVIRGERLKITPALDDYAKEKISKIEKYLPNDKNIEVKVLMKTKGVSQTIEVTVFLNNYILRVEENHNDMYAAIDLAAEKLERNLIKYKSKISDKLDVRLEKEYIEIEDSNEEIVKTKKVFLKPMSKEEAITQMELLSHTFFVFKDSEDLKIKVVYKRKDEKYGIIEAE